LLQQGAEILSHLGETRVSALGLGLFVFAATVCAEWITPRIPGHASSFWRQAALSKLTSPRRRFSLSFIKDCAQRKITVAVAHLESLRAQDGFERFGITDALPQTHLFLQRGRSD
jgi:hypothetical protein